MFNKDVMTSLGKGKVISTGTSGRNNDLVYKVMLESGREELFYIYELQELDSIVEEVRSDLHNRSQIGIKKYKTTLDRNDLELKEWLIHAYEECLDQSLYLKKSIKQLEQKTNSYE